MPNLKPITTTEESIGFYYELGRTVAAWAQVELVLYQVAAMAFKKPERKTFETAFFSIDSFYNKLKVADRLLRSKYAQHAEAWAAVYRELERLAGIRNQLAHNPVERYHHSKPGRRWAIVQRLPAPQKIRQKVPLPPSDSLCLKQIIHAQVQFEKMEHALMFHFHNLKSRRKPPKEVLLPRVGEMDSDLVTRRIRAILSTLGPLPPLEYRN